MQGYTTSSIIGSTSPGSISNDVLYRDAAGNFVLNDSAKSILHVAHPIQKITIYSGWVVDGVSITYQAEGGDTTTLRHGSEFSESPTAVVAFNANEVIVGVYGRAGYHAFFERNLVTSIAFIIFDKALGTHRTAGPFGNDDDTNQGTPFWVSDVLAFGSFAQDTPSVGLSGLFFIKNPSN